MVTALSATTIGSKEVMAQIKAAAKRHNMFVSEFLTALFLNHEQKPFLPVKAYKGRSSTNRDLETLAYQYGLTIEMLLDKMEKILEKESK